MWGKLVAVTTVLQRGVLARFRTLRWFDAISWLLVVLGGIALADSGPSTSIVAALAVGTGARVLVATERMWCDELGVSWRTFVITRTVPWQEIASIEISIRPVRTPLRGATVVVAGLEVILASGATPWRPRPAEWVSIARLTEFVAAARLASPHEWWTPADHAREHRRQAVGAMVGRPRGRRVGRPIPRRREPPQG